MARAADVRVAARRRGRLPHDRVDVAEQREVTVAQPALVLEQRADREDEPARGEHVAEHARDADAVRHPECRDADEDGAERDGGGRHSPSEDRGGQTDVGHQHEQRRDEGLRRERDDPCAEDLVGVRHHHRQAPPAATPPVDRDIPGKDDEQHRVEDPLAVRAEAGISATQPASARTDT